MAETLKQSIISRKIYLKSNHSCLLEKALLELKGINQSNEGSPQSNEPLEKFSQHKRKNRLKSHSTLQELAIRCRELKVDPGKTQKETMEEELLQKIRPTKNSQR